MKVLFASRSESAEDWLPRLRAALPGDEFIERGDADVALVADPPPGTLEKLGGAKLIQSLWMGVENLVADPALPRHVPLARLVDPGMVAAMSEMVLAHVLDWHRHLYLYRYHQGNVTWRQLEQKLASDRTVGILGLGTLGTDAARKLVALGFNVVGYSRRPKDIAGVRRVTDLQLFFEQTEALVCLLPLTPQTRGILNAENLKSLRQGGCVINLARGGHVVSADLIAALDSGHLAHAYLDVFECEPLPADDPLWRHPSVTLTPHVAALTEPRTAVPVVVENIERVRRGKAPLHLVDREAGY
ncbi:MAG TPA: glyoxylate/hydroxypyruvate reductase A [Burkholderiales bacterium]|nr:glyoxylate/hydroxypyruvate reductase A [Burkholderiales bacterium]